MHPEIFKIGPLAVNSYGLMIGLGLLLSFQVVLREAQRTGHRVLADNLESMFLWQAGAAFVGGKLAFALFYPDQFASIRQQGLMTMIGKGFVFYGSMALCVPVLIWFLRKHRLPLMRTLDVIILGAPVIHGFGRLGCFLAGCCYGCKTDGVIAVTYPSDGQASAIAGIPVHPVQLYESLGLFAIFAILFLVVRHRTRFFGQLFFTYLMLYSVLRFVTEFFRGDGNPTVVGGGDRATVSAGTDGLSLGQFTSILLVVVSIVFLVRGLRNAAQKKEAATT